MKRSYKEEPFFLPEEDFGRGIPRRRTMAKRSRPDKTAASPSRDVDRYSNEDREKLRSDCADRCRSLGRGNTGYPPAVARIPDVSRPDVVSRGHRSARGGNFHHHKKTESRGIRLSVLSLILIWVSGLTAGGLTGGFLGTIGIFGGGSQRSVQVAEDPVQEQSVPEETVFSVTSDQNTVGRFPDPKDAVKPAGDQMTAAQQWGNTNFNDIPAWEKSVSPEVTEAERPFVADASSPARNDLVVSSIPSGGEMVSVVSNPVQVDSTESMLDMETEPINEPTYGWDQLASATVEQVTEPTVVQKPEIPMKNESTPFDPSIGFAAYNTDPNSIYGGDISRSEDDLPVAAVTEQSKVNLSVQTSSARGRFSDYRIQTGNPKTTAMLPQGVGSVH